MKISIRLIVSKAQKAVMKFLLTLLFVVVASDPDSVIQSKQKTYRISTTE